MMLNQVLVARYEPEEDVSQTVDWVQDRLAKFHDMGILGNAASVAVLAMSVNDIASVMDETLSESILVVLPGYDRNWFPLSGNYQPNRPVPMTIQNKVEWIIAKASAHKIPLFGICGGFQAIANTLHSGSLRAGGFSGNRVFVSSSDVDGWEAVFDHNYCVTRDIYGGIASPYYYHLVDNNGSSIALSAALFSSRIAGVQFHPEWAPEMSGSEVADELLSYVLYDANHLKESA